MVERDRSDLSIVRQCRLLSISRSTFYAPPQGESDGNLAIMAEIDRQFLDTPFYGVRQMAWHLRAKGWPVNVKRVRRLMRKMGLMPIYQRPKTSTPALGHKIYPYLLRGLTIDRPNQVWCTDLTYIPLARGFLYLVAIMDWWSRKVLAWRLSNTMEAEFCVDALEEAMARYGKPEIFNSDQGSHVWMPRLMQAVLERFWTCDRVRSCVRPGRCGLPHAAGRYGDARTRCRSVQRARRLGLPFCFSRSGSDRSFALTVL